MTSDKPQVPWSDDQWEKVKQVVQEEAQRSRVAASFLELYGPLPGCTDFVRDQSISSVLSTNPPPPQRLAISDTDIIKLPTLQVKVFIRGAQMLEPELGSVLALFRRSANVLARLEDAIIFNGQPQASIDSALAPDPAADESLHDWMSRVNGLPPIWQILGGASTRGLLPPSDPSNSDPRELRDDWVPIQFRDPSINVAAQNPQLGNAIVETVSRAIGTLESRGHFGPFAVVLGQNLFTAVQTPNSSSLVLPQDRILPFLSGGPLLRSTLLPPDRGVIVGLGGNPLEIVVATDVSVNFLQVTTDPMFAFRIYEKLALRIRNQDAIIGLYLNLSTPA
jgi:uncharacterized linocin/CFP29 family protein